MTVSISIIIPVHNGGELFRQCLASISESGKAPDEVIVVADGDTDGSWQLAQFWGAEVVRLSQTGGPARARNQGAKIASGDILFFMDADVTLHNDTLVKIEQEFIASPDLAALIGSYDDAPAADNFLSQYKNLFHHYTHQVSSATASTFWGACGAIRRSIFHKTGGFDESYRNPCIEDIELGYRLKQAGYRIRLCKTIHVKHLKRWQPVSLLRAEIFYRALPWAELILRRRCLDADLNLSYTNRLSVLLTFGLVGSALGMAVVPWSIMLMFTCAMSLLIVNRQLYRFFYLKRGLGFTLKAIPWHWLYFLYGGGSFALVLVGHALAFPVKRFQLGWSPITHNKV